MADEELETEDGGEAAPHGWTKRELIEVAELSPRSFDTIRKAARIKGPSHGGLNHVFDQEDMFALIQKAESGKFTVLGPVAARAWRVLLVEAGIVMPEVISRGRRGRTEDVIKRRVGS
jgi:hypothetical protein